MIDAVLLVAFGGPTAPAEIRPFLDIVARGRRIPPERLERVAQQYERMPGGRSPLRELTEAQAEGLRAALTARGRPLPVYVGMRNWHPFLIDTLAEMSRAGIRRAVGFVAAAHRSYSSCTQYRENVAEARAGLARRGLKDVEITFVPDWYTHDGFIAANADNVGRARRQLPFTTVHDASGSKALIAFAASSVPSPRSFS